VKRPTTKCPTAQRITSSITENKPNIPSSLISFKKLCSPIAKNSQILYKKKVPILSLRSFNFYMDKLKAFQKLYEDCSKLGIDETSSLLVSGRNKEEVGFFKVVCDYVLQQRQKKAIEEHRF
jgi:hypothetical protein